MNDSPVRVPLRLSKVFPPEAIRVGLEARSKQSVIETLVQHAVSLSYLRLQDAAQILKLLFDREVQASTGLGHGLAIPHCEWPLLDRVVGVAALMNSGIAYDALDGNPVDKIFLTIAPPKQHAQSRDVLGRLLAVLRSTSQQLLLGECKTAMQVTAFLDRNTQPTTRSLDDLAHLSLDHPRPDVSDPWRDLAFFSLTLGSHDAENDQKSTRRGKTGRS